jgi:UPF0755 protein
MSGDQQYETDYSGNTGRRRPQAGRRRSGVSRLGSILSGILTLALVLTVTAVGGFFYLKSQFEGEGPLSRESAFMVSQGEGLAQIAGNLEDQGIIRDSRLFIAGAFLTDSRNKLKAGEYELPANVSMEEILDTLVAGRSVQHKLTVPEGLTSEQVVERVLAHPVLVGDVTDVPAEGAILPDTYVFLRGMTRQNLLDRMRNAQKKAIEDLWPKRASGLPIETPEQAVILASIVEKETAKSEERARVAAVFVNRLKRNVRLQSDPTIIYGIVGGKGVLDRPITKADIAEKTAYNTYHINGLPPTPIANPGVAAIEAVLNPATSNELYFVADGTGGHAFAETLADHRKNVALWRQIEAERRRLQAAKEDADKAQIAASTPPPATATDEGEETASAVASVSELPPPPPSPPSAEPVGAHKEASRVPVPKPKPAVAPEITGAVAVAAVEQEVSATEQNEQSRPAPPGEGETPLTRSGVPVPKPRPKPDFQVVDEDAAPDGPDRVDEFEAAPAAPTVIRPTSPGPARRQTSTTTRDGFR